MKKHTQLMAMTNIQTWKDNLGDQTMTNIQRTFSRQWLILKITQSKVSSFEIGKKLLKISPHGSYHPLPNSGSHAQCSLQQSQNDVSKIVTSKPYFICLCILPVKLLAVAAIKALVATEAIAPSEITKFSSNAASFPEIPLITTSLATF